jgi:hypothetical protein
MGPVGSSQAGSPEGLLLRSFLVGTVTSTPRANIFGDALAGRPTRLHIVRLQR